VLWVGIVRYRREGLLYEHAVNGELLTVVEGDLERYGVQG